MRRSMITVMVAAGVCVPAVSGFQLKTPADWKWRTDAPAAVTDNDKNMSPTNWFYVGMPPGWHITTNPGLVLFHPAHEGRGNFSVRSEIFLFPGDNQAEYGLFVGGRTLEQASTTPAYTAFVLRRDGQAAILKRTGTGTTALVNWKANTGAVPQSGAEAKKNTLNVDVGATDVVFSVNDTEVARVPRTEVVTDGSVGFRIGPSLNLHVTTFDLTYRLAPVPVKK